MTWKRHKLRAVREAQADDATREIYSEIKEELGIPYVPAMIQVFASSPEFLRLFWERARPVVETREFFAAAERLRAEAYTRMHNYFHVPNLRAKLEAMEFSPGAQAELKKAVELYQYSNPVLLELSAALMQAFEHPDAAARQGSGPATHPSNPDRPVLVEEENAPPMTRRIYDDIKRTLGTAFLNTSYVHFGRWPEFLQAYWETVKPMIATALFEQNSRAMRDSALALTSELPQPLQLSMAELEESGVGRDEITAIVQASETFLELMSKQTLIVSFAKIGLEGGVRPVVAA
jgi:halocarboxylic acid dehydrogenase DehI